MPTRSAWRLGLAAAAVLIGLSTPLCLGLTLFVRDRVELFHLALFNACTLRTYAVHWQDRALPTNLRFDFIKSPDSLVALELWVKDGPTISLHRPLVLGC